MADIFIHPDACVLEIGGGSGAVSTIIQEHLRNRENHVVIQPTEGEGSETPMFGGINALRENKTSCKHKYTIVDHILKPGEGKSLLKMVSKPFDTLVADCEGCLIREYEKNPTLFKSLTMAILERDDLELGSAAAAFLIVAIVLAIVLAIKTKPKVPAKHL